MLGPLTHRIRNWPSNDNIIWHEEALDIALMKQYQVDLLLSFGYRHLLTADVLGAVNGNAFNLHISYLPWNRGADPNLWSWLEDTPKGVSLHWMTESLDKGPIVDQTLLSLEPDMTLRESHQFLISEGLLMIAHNTSILRSGNAPRLPQAKGGTYHRLADKEAHLDALTKGWDTTCREIQKYGKKIGLQNYML